MYGGRFAIFLSFGLERIKFFSRDNGLCMVSFQRCGFRCLRCALRARELCRVIKREERHEEKAFADVVGNNGAEEGRSPG